MRNDYIDILGARPCRILDSKEEYYMKVLADRITCDESEITFSFYDGRKMTGNSRVGMENRLKDFYKEKVLGYVFYYQPTEDVAIPIADYYFMDGKYRPILAYSATIDNLRLELHQERVEAEREAKRREIRRRQEIKERARKDARNKKVKYVLQKFVAPGVAITVGGMIVLSSIGAIHNAFTKDPIPIVQQESDLYTVANANDILLFSWANYAMGELSELAANSENEHIYNLSEDMRVNYFTPIMREYYNYVEEGLLDLPIELTGEAIKTQHNSFRNNAYLFDEELQDRGFKNCTFANSPYANAIVVDAYGQIVTGSESGLFGEVYDSKGDLVTLESEMGYTVYVRAEDVLGNDYGTSNYPDDAIMYKGVAYVSSSHLNDYEAPSMGSK